MNQAFIALGTNIEPRETYLKDALNEVVEESHTKIVKSSAIYETAPVGYLDQSNFLNMVIKVETSLASIDLLDYCQGIEQQLGRKRSIRNGPRTIDLDILLYNQENSNTERLILPHPRMQERAFVIIPLNEIEPDLCIEGQGKSVAYLEGNLPVDDKKDVRVWKQK